MRAGNAGPTVDQWSTGPVFVDVLRYEPGVTLPPHTYEAFHLCFVAWGSCVELRGGATHRYRGPAVTVNVPATRQTIEIGPDGAGCLSIEVQDRWLGSVEAETPGTHLPARLEPAVNVRDPLRITEFVRLLEALAQGDELAELVLEERLLDVLLGLGRGSPAPGRPPTWVERVMERLRDDPTDTPTLAELASEAGVHRVHLARTFKRHYGRSVGEALRRLRLRKAFEEIANSDAALGRIALRAGFYDQSHFNRHFRRLVGMTPGRFRRLMRPV